MLARVRRTVQPASIVEAAKEDITVSRDANGCPITVVMWPVRSPQPSIDAGSGALTFHAVRTIGFPCEAYRGMALHREELADTTLKLTVNSWVLSSSNSLRPALGRAGVLGRPVAGALRDPPRATFGSGDKGLEQALWGVDARQLEAGHGRVVQFPRQGSPQLPIFGIHAAIHKRPHRSRLHGIL